MSDQNYEPSDEMQSQTVWTKLRNYYTEMMPIIYSDF